MANDPKNPEIGELIIDASDMISFVVDLPPGSLRGMQSERSGFAEVLKEIFAKQELSGDAAGVTAADIEALRANTERIAMIDVRLPAARKLVELLEETRALLDDQRQRTVSAIALSVESRAKSMRTPELLARYEKTRAYRSAVAA